MSQPNRPVKLALPKGSLQKTTAEFLARAGLVVEDYHEKSRSYRPPSRMSGVEVKVLRPQEIPLLVSRGYYDLGISGMDWYLESGVESNVETLVDLGFGAVDIVLAVPDSWTEVSSPQDLFKKFHSSAGKLRIWTEYLNLADRFIYQYEGTEPTVISPYRGIQRERHSGIEIFHSFGATESKPPEDGEAIIDNTATGKTLQENHLKIIHQVLRGSTAQLLANRRSLLDPAKQDRIDTLREAMRSVAKPRVNRPGFFGHLRD